MDKHGLENWANEALEFYNKTAAILNSSFYYFQKPGDFDHECDLLLIGLHPGLNLSEDFVSQYTNDRWKPLFKITGEGTDEQKAEMTYDGLFAGNPFYTEESNWGIIKGMEKVGLDRKSLDKVGNWQFINYIPFTKECNGHLVKECMEYTKQYIEAVKPKKIIMMGTREGIDIFKRTGKQEIMLLQRQFRRIIKTCLSGIPTLAIPNPSRYRGWEALAKEKMTEMIRLFLSGRGDEIKLTKV